MLVGTNAEELALEPNPRWKFDELLRDEVKRLCVNPERQQRGLVIYTRRHFSKRNLKEHPDREATSR